MRELRNDKLLEKSKLIYHNILELKKIDIDNNYCANLLDWFNEIITKNIVIYKSKKSKTVQDHETYKKTRQKFIG